ncbi:putative bifunctional diguanylate cyclase/phosphodiesterase [Euzebya tangerina]|uniref:putative bifunctional diguanylate cyclase/phosphodiesterase n=1 Tax=Euzebya tangerina TaxID=591198 RepID=UPI000E3245FD|nr:bifunctional diguanylate cyclase/phosphodiesterase [Euzebya tangerina]
MTPTEPTTEDRRRDLRLVGLAGLALGLSAALALATTGPALDLSVEQAAAGVVGMGALLYAAEAFKLTIQYRDQNVASTLSMVPIMIGLVFLGPVVTTVGRIISTLAYFGVRRRQPVIKVIVNGSAAVLEVWVTAAVLSLFGSFGDRLLEPGGWLAIGGAGIVGGLSSALVVVAAIRLSVGPLQDGALSQVFTGVSINAVIEVPLSVLAVAMIELNFATVVLLGPFVYLLATTNRQRHLLQDNLRDVKGLYGFISALSTAKSVEEVVRNSLIQGKQISGATDAWLVTLQDTTAIKWRLEDDQVVREPLDALSGAAFLHAAQHGALFEHDDVIDVSVRGVLGAPFSQVLVGPFNGSQIRGAIALVDRVSDQPLFHTDDIELAVALAGHAGTTLGSTHLFDVVQRESARRERLALHDASTGLRNRNGLLEDLPTLREGAVFAVGINDLRAFGTSFGHEVSEAVAIAVAKRLDDLREDGVRVARISSAQFAVTVSGACDPAEADAWARRIVRTASGPVETGDVEINAGVRVGVALAPQHGTNMRDLLRASDRALTEAYREELATGWFEFERDRETTRRLELASELRVAIENEHLRLAYQPKVELATGRVVGVEALARWPHAQRGFISPLEFIDIAERTGLIRPLTLWATRTAVEQCAKWREDGMDISVAINLSNAALQGSDLPWEIVNIVEEYDLPPGAVIMEITESQILDELDGQSGALSVFNAAGIQLSVDDFGTGYSSLAHMKRLEVQELKIDRAFVTNMGVDAVDRSLTSAMISMARELGLRVVAEGVEDEAALALLQDMACDVGQGYLFERPQPASELPRAVAELEATLNGNVTRLQRKTI